MYVYLCMFKTLGNVPSYLLGLWLPDIKNLAAYASSSSLDGLYLRLYQNLAPALAKIWLFFQIRQKSDSGHIMAGYVPDL